jgi:hypothetical protein
MEKFPPVWSHCALLQKFFFVNTVNCKFFVETFPKNVCDVLCCKNQAYKKPSILVRCNTRNQSYDRCICIQLPTTLLG